MGKLIFEFFKTSNFQNSITPSHLPGRATNRIPLHLRLLTGDENHRTRRLPFTVLQQQRHRSRLGLRTDPPEPVPDRPQGGEGDLPCAQREVGRAVGGGSQEESVQPVPGGGGGRGGGWWQRASSCGRIVRESLLPDRCDRLYTDACLGTLSAIYPPRVCCCAFDALNIHCDACLIQDEEINRVLSFPPGG